jgi:hypothetical protein
MSEEKKEHCGKCWKLDHPKAFCDRYKKGVDARRSDVSRALDIFYKLPECIEVQKGETVIGNEKTISLAAEEAAIIASAVENAVCWGTGILTTCQEAIQNAGYYWTDGHVEYVFENYVDV